MYEVSDDVVCGPYYQKKGKDSYVLLNDSYLVNCHFHLIRLIKFSHHLMIIKWLKMILSINF